MQRPTSFQFRTSDLERAQIRTGKAALGYFTESDYARDMALVGNGIGIDAGTVIDALATITHESIPDLIATMAIEWVAKYQAHQDVYGDTPKVFDEFSWRSQGILPGDRWLAERRAAYVQELKQAKRSLAELRGQEKHDEDGE